MKDLLKYKIKYKSRCEQFEKEYCQECSHRERCRGPKDSAGFTFSTDTGKALYLFVFDKSFNKFCCDYNDEACELLGTIYQQLKKEDDQ